MCASCGPGESRPRAPDANETLPSASLDGGRADVCGGHAAVGQCVPADGILFRMDGGISAEAGLLSDGARGRVELEIVVSRSRAGILGGKAGQLWLAGEMRRDLAIRWDPRR